jgi:hypothetical protein
MTMNATTPLRWGAAVFAVFWTATMPCWAGSSEPFEILIFVLCGALGGYGWYYAMCFGFRYAGLLPPD